MGRTPLRAAVAAIVLVAVAVAGCRDGGPRAVEDPFGGGYPTFRDDASGITAILGTPDLAVGRFRVALALSDDSGLVRYPALTLRSYAPGAEGALRTAAQEVSADFHPFPDGSRGLYSATMSFDRPGEWTIVASVPRPDGREALVTVPVTVAEEASAPVVGSPAPASENRVEDDVPSLDRLTTGSAPDPALYRHRIADSLAAHRPLVVIFASPAFCTTPLCGPQVEDASELVRAYGDRVDFVHVDLYQDPHEIKGDLAGAKRSPLVEEWGLGTEQWTFVIDANGTVTARFEAYAPRPELETAIRDMLGERG